MSSILVSSLKSFNVLAQTSLQKACIMKHVHDPSDDRGFLLRNIKPDIEGFNQSAAHILARIRRDVFEGFKKSLELNQHLQHVR